VCEGEERRGEDRSAERIRRVDSAGGLCAYRAEYSRVVLGREVSWTGVYG
jgi:hypothetical protein